ncbi:MAG TPA: flagellin lysine-N-methylase [Candidatus Eubacterium faecigallinarum]|nr:flagellin lysine-N-methylase [Candidatus Eubacterium faecigallinarum]
MILKTPSFYKDFKCIAGDCPDSCCQGWEVDADRESLEYYKNLTGDIKNKIDSVLDRDEFGNTIFRLADKKRCPFLNNENLCDMHIAIGGEHTPYTCRMFPRFINDFGGTREMGLSFSCPVAADIMFYLKQSMSFVSEVNDLPPQLNEIDAETYYFLVNARKKAFSLVQDRTKPVNERLTELLDYGVQLQKELDDYEEGSDETDFFDVFRNPELINTQWTEKVNNAHIKSVSNEIFNENIASYFIFRYFLGAVNDYDVLSKIKMAVVGVLVVTYFGEDSWTIHLWSKETEHSQYNMDRYVKLLKDAACLSVKKLKRRLNY